MNSNFTEAVSADTTAQEPVVKRHKRGDVREDGKIFWAYGKRYSNGEWWVSPEKFEENRQSKAKTDAKFLSLNPKYYKEWRQENQEQVRASGKAWREANADKKKRDARRWYEQNKEKVISCARRWKQRNPEKTRESGRLSRLRNLEKAAARSRLWRENNRERNLENVRKYRAKRSQEDPIFRARRNLSCRTAKAFRAKNHAKKKSLAFMLGCPLLEFQQHIANLFLPGMTLQNYGKWHIDHIVPLVLGVTIEQLEALSHFTNLRPMWGRANCSKNAKLPEENELPDNLHPKVREIYLTAATTSGKGYPA